jgi:hypothetical protein
MVENAAESGRGGGVSTNAQATCGSFLVEQTMSMALQVRIIFI